MICAGYRYVRTGIIYQEYVYSNEDNTQFFVHIWSVDFFCVQDNATREEFDQFIVQEKLAIFQECSDLVISMELFLRKQLPDMPHSTFKINTSAHGANWCHFVPWIWVILGPSPGCAPPPPPRW